MCILFKLEHPDYYHFNMNLILKKWRGISRPLWTNSFILHLHISCAQRPTELAATELDGAATAGATAVDQVGLLSVARKRRTVFTSSG